MPLCSINPNYTEAMTALAFLLAEDGKLDEGWALMQRGVAISPSQPDVLSNSANYLVRMGKQMVALSGLVGGVWVCWEKRVHVRIR